MGLGNSGSGRRERDEDGIISRSSASPHGHSGFQSGAGKAEKLEKSPHAFIFFSVMSPSCSRCCQVEA